MAQGWVSAPAPGLGGLQVPAAGPGPLGSAFHLGLPASRGRSLGRVSGRTPRRPRQVPGAGTRAAVGDGFRQAEVTGTCYRSAAVCFPCLGAPDFSAVCTSGRGGGGGSSHTRGSAAVASRGGRCPSIPAWKRRPRRPAATAATRNARPARRVPGPSRERPRRAEDAAGDGGRATIP